MAERDRMFAQHPKTHVHRWRTSAGTPTTWRALAQLLDEMPNVYAEVGAILYDLGRQPRAAHDFFVKYQDRCCSARTAIQPDEYPVLLARVRDHRRVLRLLPRLPRVLEAVRHGLPDEVLKKLYYGNALKLMPGLPRAGFTD